jgi:hypothetical protein
MVHLGMSGRMLISGEMLGASTTTIRRPKARPCRPRHGGRRPHHLQRRPALRRDGPRADTPRSRRTGCWRASGPSRSATASTRTISSRGSMGGTRRSRPRFSTSGRRGLGNIYVCEALHRAGISPRRKAGRIAGRGRAPRARDPRGAGRGDRGRGLVPARPPADGRRTGVFPAHLPRLRPRGRSPADPGLPGP